MTGAETKKKICVFCRDTRERHVKEAFRYSSIGTNAQLRLAKWYGKEVLRFDSGKEHAVFFVKFCPMCGRSLEGNG